MMKTCPLCLSSEVEPLFEIGAFHIFRCRACTGGFADPRDSGVEGQSLYDSSYFETYHTGPMEGPSFALLRYQRLMDSIHSMLDIAGQKSERQLKILDVGCASGYLLDLFRHDGWAAVGVELSPAAVDFARRTLDLQVLQGGFLEAPLPPNEFDLVTMFHVIEHLPEPGAAVEKAYRLLRDKGILFLETPNWDGLGALVRGRHWSHYIPPEHLNYFGPGSLERLLRSNGFQHMQAATFTPPILVGIGGLASPLRRMVRLAYDLANSIGRGPSLQLLAVRT
jgi:SAM-dependent methyltransferase